MARFIPMGSIVTGLADTEGKASAEVVAAFQQGRRPIPRSEWDVPLDRVSMSASLGAAVGLVGYGVGCASTKAAEAAAPHLERASVSTMAAVGKATDKAEDVAAKGLANLQLGASYVKGLWK